MANDSVQELGLATRVTDQQVEVISSSVNDYGVPDKAIMRSKQFIAGTEGLIADPVYEGRAIHGLQRLAAGSLFEKNARILLMREWD